MKEPDRLPTDITSPDYLMELASAFQRSRVFLTACELEVFTALGEARRTSKEVAEAIGADVRATDRLLNALAALGLVDKKEGRFSNLALTHRFLIKGKPEYMGGFMHFISMWESWGTLTKAVRKGKSVVNKERDDKWLQAFITRMHDGARRYAPEVLELVDLSRVSQLLDLGGGPGDYAMAFVRAKEGLRATVFDLPEVIPLTQNYIRQEMLADRIDTVGGDFHKDDFGTGFDLVFMSAIIHIYSERQNKALVKKAYHALDLGGQLIIKDVIMDEDRRSPLTGALFALNMLVATDSGDTYTESEVRKWMEESGFCDILRKDTVSGTTIMIGRKPAE